MRAESLFVSDLHLSAATPEALTRFLGFLSNRAAEASALFILGDLFDVYLGDDDRSSPFRDIRMALRALSDRGVRIFLQHGNRDFLIGDEFLQATRATLLAEESVIDLHGRPTLLCHGDLLCSDDVDYLKARARVRTPEWKAHALSKPLWMRRLYARWYRFKSGRDKDKKTQDIMDANESTIVSKALRFGVDHLIHGHTHRPGLSRHAYEKGTLDRWVLPEWNGLEWLLVVDERGARAEPLSALSQVPSRPSVAEAIS